MFELPGLKLEKGCNYLEKQLQLQLNNKEQILDIINNVNHASDETSNIKSTCYADLVNDANKVLNSISNNISSIEKLNFELKNLNNEINNAINAHPQKRKTKKFYTQLFPDLETNLSTHSKTFKEIESKLITDNVCFTEFINKTNLSCDVSIDEPQKNNNILENNSSNESEEFEEFNLNLSITSDFMEKINNTTSFNFEYMSCEDASKKHTQLSENSREEISNSLVKSINPEVENDKLLNLLDELNSGDVLLLSLSIPDNNNSDALEISKNSKDIEDQEEAIENSENEENIPVSTPSVPTLLEEKAETLTKNSYKEKIEKIENGVEDNKTLLISERLGKIYLPYKKNELSHYIENYPDKYKSLQDVVNQKFILPFTFFKNQSSKSRFSETYDLLKNRDGQNFIKSVSYAFKVTGKRNLNPTIIASCKNKFELESYIYYLDSNNLNNFRFFDIIYEVNPLKK